VGLAVAVTRGIASPPFPFVFLLSAVAFRERTKSSMTRLEVKSLCVPALVGLALLSLVLCPCGIGAQRSPNTSGCDVRVDLQYELRPGTTVRSPIGEVAPKVARLIMNKSGEGQWHELTKQGKKYPSICLDDEHPYYVLVWSTIGATDISDASANADLYVLDDGCLVVPGCLWDCFC